MCPGTSVDRRQHARSPLSSSVQFYHCPSRRQFPARSVDVSEGGLLMYVPMSTPVTKGQTIRLDIGSTSRPELRGLPSPIEAVVVRVDRNKLLDLGHLVVGVQFNREASPQA